MLVWGGVSYDGATELYIIRNGSLIGIGNRDKILVKIVCPFAGAVGPGFL